MPDPTKKVLDSIPMRNKAIDTLKSKFKYNNLFSVWNDKLELQVQLDDCMNQSSSQKKELTKKTEIVEQEEAKSIQQKEIFANNITATRKGVIVESEGVVFKDIIIKGTTGVFPHQRGSATIRSMSIVLK